MNGGYMGKMLLVNLSEGTLDEQPLTHDTAKNYMGGPGLGARVLYDMMQPDIDPLGPDNVIGYVTGPVTGSGACFGSRFTVVCKSPVSGTFSDANAGGFFGSELKRAGYDAVFVSGAAKKPVYLWIHNGKAEIRSAVKLWGKDCKETLELMREETGEPKMRASVIGPAGENLSMISCPINDGHRAPARGGAGAVMGSKKLKGIAVRGTGRIPVGNHARIKTINRSMLASMQDSPRAKVLGGWSKYGTGFGTGDSFLAGRVPIKNWTGAGGIDFSEEQADRISAISLNRYKVKKYACFSCPLGCGAEYKVEGGKWPLPHTDRPEYETLAVFGLNCLNDDGEAIMKCNDICNRAGLDTVSTGATVAWVLECYEKGILTKDELDGIEAAWRNPEAIVALTEKIAKGDGCGRILARGSAGAAKQWGKGGEYVQAVMGIELPMHDSRFAPGMARTYVCDPTPARHVKGGLGSMHMFDTSPAKYNYEDTGYADLIETCALEITNASGICLLWSLSGAPRDTLLQILGAVTGWSLTDQDQLRFGRRSMAIKQAFNVREGLKPADFIMPPRAVGQPPLQEGPLAGITVDYKLLRQSFFDAIGWDMETGKPTLASLKELGLDDVAKDLYG